MTNSNDSRPKSLLLMIAGAKGAVGSTVAAAVAAMQKNPDVILPSLITRNSFVYLGPPESITMAGWDAQSANLVDCIENHGVLTDNLLKPLQKNLEETPIFASPAQDLDLKGQVAHLTKDIQDFKKQHPHALPVMINLLPACTCCNLDTVKHVDDLYAGVNPVNFPDLAYVLAAIFSEIPVVNFSPNRLEIPVVVQTAVEHRIPISGRDGKTGQTYFKVVLASALKARSLYVDGWYSLNILGNADGKNLMDPDRAAGKVANKTELLDEILGYSVGERYQEPTHKVRIDYYPPRGDAKEAWDVVDFKGLFDLPMSLRLNMQGRDSILAAPMVLDLARWMAALKMAGCSGSVPELGFYFKKPIGENPPLSFQDQVHRLQMLEKECDEKCLKGK
ncbi:MAG: inositol-3-phosphate synthase [Desulfobacteraceae bacterium]|nr:inositol-3-phosphate synthase [Desulfobacteraceae bacterium]MDH3721094.1 inositol-3-phosphate synthase [Desulfobacteraceae bacterium]MDH3874445.1 inositol-3-phosphate synthase [Desulfobacteraceae bacterium]